MQLTLIKRDEILRFGLPGKRSGQYWVTHIDAAGNRVNLISVEGVDSAWVLKSNRNAAVLDEKLSRVREVVLEPNRFYDIATTDGDERLLLHSEPSTEDRKRFRKYLLPRQGTVVIGRTEGCDIRFASKFTSSKHAEINIFAESVELRDLDSSNGTFVNGKRVGHASLAPGDVTSITGMTIVLGRGFIVVNNPDGLVTCNEAVLKPLSMQEVEAADNEDLEESPPGVRFFRSPRFKRDIATKVIKIDGPPQLNNMDEMPLTMVLGPALTMGIASLFMGIFAVVNALDSGGGITRALPTLIMSLSMMTGMVLWPILTRRHEKKVRREREEERQRKYRAYLNELGNVIEAERARQSEILHENIATIGDCVNRIKLRERSLWERTIDHNDFLKLRLGLGQWSFDVELKHPERKFTIDDDDLQDLLFSLVETPRVLKDVPVSISLIEYPHIGIIGDARLTTDLLKSLVIQLAALHSYDELKFAFIFDEREAPDWEFARWLPHTWSDDRSMRYVATSQSEVRNLTAHLERVLAKRTTGAALNEAVQDSVPHYIIFALDKNLAEKSEFVRKVLQYQKKCGFYVVNRYSELHELPKESKAVIEVDEGTSRIFEKNDITGAYRAFVLDVGLQDDARELAQYLANTHLDQASGAFSLPSMLTFLEMFGVGKVEHLNSRTRWRENNPVLSLEAPVGVDSNGDLLKLDLHEKRHGPHGLIAGMTGSGKSEFIMTYILSLAVNYHPDEVAFVLIDYKGGGMANAFASLPHVVGLITNLDGAAVNRSLVSIQSELKRRQAIFNQASSQTHISNIDIYKYQSLYRERVVSEPLPHLLVISDEFAELKTQQPDFMTQLVSAARIGRSLGVHLILATQKPSGVVDDQIWSNSRFRVCLKVQEKADSMEVIKRADAAELAETGRFYLQVGFNELFEIGQSAWAGAPYFPADRVERAYDSTVVLVDNLGQPLRQAQIDRRKARSSNPSKQLDEVARYLTQLASEEGIVARRLWLEPIPERVNLDELVRKYELRPATKFVLDPLVGEYDDPENQEQHSLTVPISAEGNVVVYGSTGSGKTMFLTTLIYSLIERHTPEEVNLYLLDFESETLRNFARAPHVGDVLFSSDGDKLSSLLKMLSEEITKRRSLFAEYGGDYMSFVRDSGQRLESIVVVIHNYSAFVETHEDVEDAIAFLTREGVRYGVFFVMTAASTSAVRYRILQNFKQMFVLQLNDATEYGAVLGSTGGVVPSPFEGRGIFRSGRVYEFQVARVSSEVESDYTFVRSRCQHISDGWTGPVARAIPMLPERVTIEHLAAGISRSDLGVVPVGIDVKNLETVQFDFKSRFVSFVLSQTSDIEPFLLSVVEMLALQYGQRAVLLDLVGTFAGVPHPGFTHVVGVEAVEKEIVGLFEEMVRRNNATVEARTAAQDVPTFESTLHVAPSLTGLLSSLSQDATDKFTALLEKCDASLEANFVFVDTAAGLSALTFESWMSANLEAGTGIWIGDGFADQYVFKAAKTTNDMYETIGEQFGYVLDKGRHRLVKVVTSGGGFRL